MHSYRFAVEHSDKLFEVSSICLDTFSDSCDQRTCNLEALLMLLAALRIRWSSYSLVLTLCVHTIALK
jgi:hypothetical protein